MASTLIHPSSSKRWIWALVPLVLVALAVAWWMQGRDRSDQVPLVRATDTRSAWPTAPTAMATDEADDQAFPKGPVGEARPADFSQSSWDTLNSALANAPNKDQERTRVVSYLRFQRAVSKWGEMTNGPATPERLELARQVMDEMPAHVSNGEVNPTEAMAAVTAMASDMEPDASRREAWIEAQRAMLQAATQSPAQTKAMQAEQAKVQDFEKQKAEITSHWMSSPVANRDPATLEAQLQALREKVFGSQTP